MTRKNRRFSDSVTERRGGQALDTRAIRYDDPASTQLDPALALESLEMPGHDFPGRTEFDHQKRIAMYHRFHEILHEEQPYTFLFCSKELEAVDKRFRNTIVYPFGLDEREWWVPSALQRYK